MKSDLRFGNKCFFGSFAYVILLWNYQIHPTVSLFYQIFYFWSLILLYQYFSSPLARINELEEEARVRPSSERKKLKEKFEQRKNKSKKKVFNAMLIRNERKKQEERMMSERNEKEIVVAFDPNTHSGVNWTFTCGWLQ